MIVRCLEGATVGAKEWGVIMREGNMTNEEMERFMVRLAEVIVQFQQGQIPQQRLSNEIMWTVQDVASAARAELLPYVRHKQSCAGENWEECDCGLDTLTEALESNEQKG